MMGFIYIHYLCHYEKIYNIPSYSDALELSSRTDVLKTHKDTDNSLVIL
jgi:hypothetical protein